MLPFPGSSVGAYRLAEWVECGLLLGGLEGPLSRAALRDQLHEALDDADLRRFDADRLADLEPDREAQELEDLRDEEAEGLAPADLLADETFDVLEIFADVAGSGYPFSVDSRSIAVKGEPEAWPVYAFLLALSQRFLQHLRMETQRPSRLFERLSVCAWSVYLPGRAEHFGWPRDGAIGTRSFRQALPAVLGYSGERLTIPSTALPARLKDMECDVFAWRPFAEDDRRGQDVLLAQCAIGAGWDTKHVNLDRWRAFVSFAVIPRKGASFPFVPRVVRAPDLSTAEVDADEADLGAAVGLWLDRLRIAHLVGRDGAEAGLDPRLLAEMRAWTGLVAQVAQGAAPVADATDEAFTDLDEEPDALAAIAGEDGALAPPAAR